MVLGVLSVQEARQKWIEKYPESPVSCQTLRNWAKKYEFGEKRNFLPRSEWQINRYKFEKFLQDPQSYFNKGNKKNENN